MILSGVGGQGILLAARILSETALRGGRDVKSSEVHGMSQRGGSVLAQVRFGPRVFSPLTPEGSGDYLLAQEELEALRYRGLLRKDGEIILRCLRIMPSTVTAGVSEYPERIEETLKYEGYRIEAVPEAELAALKNPRFANVFMLGALSRRLEFPSRIWKEVIREAVPERFGEDNVKAFEKGRQR